MVEDRFNGVISFIQYAKRIISLQNSRMGIIINVLIITHSTAHNKGNEAIVKGLIKTLKKFVHQSLNISVLTDTPEYDFNQFQVNVCRAIYARGQSKVKPIFILTITLLWALIWRLTGLRTDSYVPRRGRALLTEYMKSDVVISRGSDSFNDTYGVQAALYQCYYVLLGLILKKPVILCAHAIGPFRNHICAFCVGKLLDNTSLITVRDQPSTEWLKTIGVVTPPIHCTADLAFLLEAAPIGTVEKILKNEKIEVKHPIIGISVSKLISHWIPCGDSNRPVDPYRPVSPQKYAQYVALMARIADFLVDKLHAKIILVSHVTHSPQNDDRDVAKDVMDIVCSKDIQMIKGEYSSEELKGIISCFDIFIGARMHSIIAALSVSVPALSIAYMPKSRGIMELVQQEEWIWDIQTMNYDLLTSKILGVWTNREKIKEHLRSRKSSLNNLAHLNGRLINKFLVKNCGSVVNRLNCTGCGTCVVVCPQSAISMVLTHSGVYMPTIEYDRCTGCGVCVKVCPIE